MALKFGCDKVLDALQEIRGTLFTEPANPPHILEWQPDIPELIQDVEWKRKGCELGNKYL